MASELFVLQHIAAFHVKHGEGCQEACCQCILRASSLQHRLLSDSRRRQVGSEVGRDGPHFSGSGAMGHRLRFLGRAWVLRWHPWTLMGCHPWNRGSRFGHSWSGQLEQAVVPLLLSLRKAIRTVSRGGDG